MAGTAGVSATKKPSSIQRTEAQKRKNSIDPAELRRSGDMVAAGEGMSKEDLRWAELKALIQGVSQQMGGGEGRHQ